ncbi:MAG: hypothetical protein AAFP03_13690 [Cyanobacteria bacterium J06598_3]
MNQNLTELNESTTAYRQQLQPWCIVQQLPNMQNRVVTRLRRRNDADDHLRVLRQRSPQMQYTIVFEPPTSAPSFTPERS